MDSPKIVKNLKKKGFVDRGGLPPKVKQAKSKRKHHDYFYLVLGKGDERVLTHIRTYASHGGKKEISKSIQSQMARQVCLSNQQFVDLVNCPLSHDAYLIELVEGGELDKELVVAHYSHLKPKLVRD